MLLFLIGTAAASLYLLGIGYLYAPMGSLNMADGPITTYGGYPAALVIATSLIVIGLGIKYPLSLHGWPDAYAQPRRR